jgi:1-acyl-sn-glycerol-3-phosphate acyltransferase
MRLILFRSLIFLLVFYGLVLIFSVALLIVGRRTKYETRCRIGRAWGDSVLWALKTICRLEHRVEGNEHLPEGAAIVLSKHQSAWETVALRTILPLRQTWVLKRELLRIPLFGRALSLFDPIAIDRKAGRKAMRQLTMEGKRSLQDGRWLVVFPEGTRVAPGQKHRYGIGGALLAEQSEYPVVPIAHNAGVFWSRRSVRKYPGIISVIIGPTIVSKGRKATEINAQAENWIEETVDRLPMRR